MPEHGYSDEEARPILALPARAEAAAGAEPERPCTSGHVSQVGAEARGGGRCLKLPVLVAGAVPLGGERSAADRAQRVGRLVLAGVLRPPAWARERARPFGAPAAHARRTAAP